VRPTRLASLLVSVALAACAPRLPAAPATPGASAFPPPERVELPGLPDDPPAPTRLLPGDVVAYRVVAVDPAEVPRAQVDGAGRLHLPLVGDVAVGGLDPSGAEAAIDRALARYDRFARASVTLVEAAGHRATVGGAVERPGAYPVAPELRLAELLALAGGPRSAIEDAEIVGVADLEGGRVVRDGAALPVSVGLAMRGDPRHNVRVRAGDVVFVPATAGRRVTVLGDVRRGRVLGYRPGLRLSEAIAAAGGASGDADLHDVRVVRGSLSAPQVYRADLRALVDGAGADVELAPGDVVYVTTRWFATAAEVTSRLTPLLAATAIGLSIAK
jgi:polysaccharide export outer membrane protein